MSPQEVTIAFTGAWPSPIVSIFCYHFLFDIPDNYAALLLGSTFLKLFIPCFIFLIAGLINCATILQWTLIFELLWLLHDTKMFFNFLYDQLSAIILFLFYYVIFGMVNSNSDCQIGT